MNVVHVLGKRQYIASTGPSIPAGGGGGFTLTVNGQTGSVWPPVRVNATMGTVRTSRPAAAVQACAAAQGGVQLMLTPWLRGCRTSP